MNAKPLADSLVPVPTKLPLALRERLRERAKERDTSLSFLIREAVETALASEPAKGGLAPGSSPRPDVAHSHTVPLHLALDHLRRTDAYAARRGIKRAQALAEIFLTGLETTEQTDGVPASRVDDLMAVLQAIEALLSQVGPAAFGTLILLAYWVAKASGGKVEEDELLQQARRVGEDEWAQALDELGPKTGGGGQDDYGGVGAPGHARDEGHA